MKQDSHSITFQQKSVAMHDELDILKLMTVFGIIFMINIFRTRARTNTMRINNNMKI